MARQRIAKMIERVQIEHQDADHNYQTYEEANWAKLSPVFRRTHNRLRVLRGLPEIPPPKIDLYKPKRGPKLTPFDPTNKEFVGAVREHYGVPMLGPRGGEGFQIKGALRDTTEAELRAIDKDPVIK